MATLLGKLFAQTSSLASTCLRYFHLTPPTYQTTLWQMHLRAGPPKRRPRTKSPISGHPQIRGIVLKTLVKRPKKPNAGNRPSALVRLTNGKEITVWIPGEGHNLQEHSQVLIQGGRKQDLIGVKCKVMRGKLDCAPVKKPDRA